MSQTNPSRHQTLSRENRILFVGDVMAILGVGQTKAYEIIRKLNDQIEEAGYERPVSGRVSEKFFRERYYLGDQKIIRLDKKRLTETEAWKEELQ